MLVLPVRDPKADLLECPATKTLIVLNAAAFFLSMSLLCDFQDDLRFTRWDLLGGFLFDPRNPRLGTFVSASFLHAGPMHFVGNMWVLWAFAPRVEDRLGSRNFLLLYVLSMFASKFLFARTLDPDATSVRLLGASGAISGVLGFHLIRFPFSMIRVLIGLGHFLGAIVPVPAFLILGLYIYGDATGVLYPPEGPGPRVAHWSHIGGMAFGIAAGAIARFRDWQGAPPPQANDTRSSTFAERLDILRE